MRIHAAAKALPDMTESEFECLVADIRQHGLLCPIEVLDEQIIDGRHRWRACQQLGIEPSFVDVTLKNGETPASYVWSLNGARRHLTPSQLAAVGADLLPEIEKDTPKGRPKKSVSKDTGYARDKAAKMVGTSPAQVARAKKVKEQLPKLFKQVKQGELNLSQAARELRKANQAAKETALAAKAAKADDWSLVASQTIVECDALISDPPYGILDEVWEPQDVEAFTRDWLTRWNECKAELVLAFFSQRYMWDAKVWFDECLSNYQFQQLLVWHYPNNKSPQSRKGFKQTWEPVLFYRRTDSERQIKVGGSKWGDGLNDFDCHVAAVPQSNFNDADRKVHPAQKPVSVMRWLINATTEQGDLVADPFCGSGTTGIAAAQLGRRFYGIETDKAMAKVARKRIKAYGVRPT